MLSLSLFGLVSQIIHAAVPCGTSGSGVLNVGFLPGNLPYSDYDSITNSAIGFDPLLITAVAKLLGYDTVNFIGYGSNALGEAALSSGAIDVYANSALVLAHPPTTFIGLVTDISDITAGVVKGWLVNLGCCTLALKIEAAISQLVQNGAYAQILQYLRLNGLTGGDTLGLPLSAAGVLQEPFPFVSSEVGTIPSACSAAAPVSLPTTNCIGAYLQSICTPGTSFTGATAPIIP